ncbi:translation initiation factor IF-2-like [Trachypithecus francoisi]|uniref:translation initiation factor IF-2-like n=1 Tax=Trachypithecus francoisi TaxID=54180 RepID=UPI00141AA1BF|nr:translation initiation factor IF-2-like [Trachypithecus francoisi]
METSGAKRNPSPPPVYLEKGCGVRQWFRGSHPKGRPPARPALQGTQPSDLPPRTKGRAPKARGPEAGDPKTPRVEAGEPRAAARARPSAGPAAPGLKTEHSWPLGDARLTPAGARASGPRPASAPARAGRQPAGLTRHEGSRPAAPRGSRTAARGLPPAPPAPPAPSPLLAAPGQHASPAQSAALTSPARGAPSAAAGARPVPAAPAAAPARAPRPRKRFPAPPPGRPRFRAGADPGGGAARWTSRQGPGS